MQKSNQERCLMNPVQLSFHPIYAFFQVTAGNSFPEGFRLSFPTRTNYMFALMKHPIPKLRAFTACLWLRPAGGGIGTPVSYAVPEEPNEMVLLQGLHAPSELLINGKVLRESAACGKLSRGCTHI